MVSVQLLRHTPDPQRNIAAAARLCYSPIGAKELNDNISDEEVAGLLRRLISMGHMSAIEHATFTFAIEGISRACSHQLVRHRVASYSQQSQRYVQFQESPDFIVPPGVTKNSYDDKFKAAFSEMFVLYNEMIKNGIDAEDARYILPQAVETKIVVTMNARELLYFFSLRCCERAQWEIRELSMKMLDLALNAAPIIFENSGPNCVRSKCREGKMTCGDPWDKRNWEETPYLETIKKIKIKNKA